MIYLAKTKNGIIGLMPDEVVEFLEVHPECMFSLEKAESVEEHACEKNPLNKEEPFFGRYEIAS